jgi:hypothetical protein
MRTLRIGILLKGLHEHGRSEGRGVQHAVLEGNIREGSADRARQEGHLAHPVQDHAPAVRIRQPWLAGISLGEQLGRVQQRRRRQLHLHIECQHELVTCLVGTHRDAAYVALETLRRQLAQAGDALLQQGRRILARALDPGRLAAVRQECNVAAAVVSGPVQQRDGAEVGREF